MPKVWRTQEVGGEQPKNPQSTSPGSIMPAFAHLPPEEIEALVRCLMTLK